MNSPRFVSISSFMWSRKRENGVWGVDFERSGAFSSSACAWPFVALPSSIAP